MKTRKNIQLFPLMLAISFVLAACGSTPSRENALMDDVSKSVEETLMIEKASDGENTEPDKESETAEPETTESETAETAEEGKILIAYYSHTGNTEEAAQKIAELTGGDLAEIQRAEEYEDLYEEAEAEILDGIHPEITVSTENIGEYDTIFVGYPIWWDEAPAMIATFLADHDFSGKTVVPFCTSASDDIDNSLHIFSELCPDAEIAEGLTANDLDEIESWLSEIGIVK